MPSQLPPNAKLAFKGRIFEVWQWEQKMFDGSTKTFERIRRPDSAVIVPVVGDMILVEEQLQPDWPRPLISLPAGICESDDEPLATAKRELLEETGYASDDWMLWQTIEPFTKILWALYVYIARDCTFVREPQLDEDGEKITTRLISFDEFLMLADESTFRDKELIEFLLRARLDPKVREEFYNFLFRNSP